jgi:outer membrane protein assembly factor BamB
MSHPARVPALFAVALALPSAAAADWPQWRGPDRDGTAGKLSLPARWPKDLTRKWRVTVGEGHSSPVVAGDRVFLFSREKDDEVVRCLELGSGKEVWKKSYPAPYEMHPAARGHGKGPKSTPAVRDGRLFTFGIGGVLTCWDAKTGKVLWRKDFAKVYKNTSPLFGTAMSPLVEGGLCVVHVGGHDKGALKAYKVDSGEEKWSWDGDGPGYASPVLVTLAGERQVVTQTQDNLVGVSWSAGKLLWRVPFTTQFEQNIISPVVYKDLVIYSGYNQPLRAVRVTKSGEEFKAKRAWENEAHPLYMSTPVVRDGLLFGMSTGRGGEIFCANAASGKTLWRAPRKGGQNAALVNAGRVLLVLTTEGRLTVLKPSATRYDPVATYKVADTPTWAHPAVVGSRVLVKDQTTLAAWSWGE